MKAETLKKSILQYAMQGKLVEQNPDDEPASELLKRIKAEKDQLIKDGKIKKEKPLPPITSDEIPYELPQGWKWARFAECLDVRDGTHDSPKYQQTGYPFITSKNLNNGKLDFSNVQYISAEDFLKFSARSYVENEDILFAMIGSIGNPVIVKKDREFSIKNVALFKKSNFISVKYLYYYLLYLQDILRNNATGAVQAFVSLSILRTSLFALPPISEQQRIVEKLEQILPLIEEYGKNEEKLSELNKTLPDKIKQSILQHAVQGKLVPQNPTDEPASELLRQIKAEKEQLIKDGKIKKEKPLPPITDDEIPFNIPSSWTWVRFQDIVQKIGSGSTPKGGKQVYTDRGVKFIRSQNVYNDGLRLPDIVYITNEINNNMSNTIVKPKDILLNITGGSIGRSCLIEDDFDIGNVNQHVSIVRPVLPEIRYFMHLYMISPIFFSIIMAEQNGISREGFSKTMHEKCLFPLPPLAEQQRIVDKVEELMKIVDRLEVDR